MDPIEVGWRYRSYVRRKKFEADVMANAVISLLAQAMAGTSPSEQVARAEEQQQILVENGRRLLAARGIK